MDALASGAGISGLNGHTSPCRFTYLCVKEPLIEVATDRDPIY